MSRHEKTQAILRWLSAFSLIIGFAAGLLCLIWAVASMPEEQFAVVVYVAIGLAVLWSAHRVVTHAVDRMWDRSDDWRDGADD